MSRPFDRRQAIAALLSGAASVTCGLAGGCAGEGTSTLGSTASIGKAAPTASTPKPATGAPVKVALLLPLSGGAQVAAIARGLKQSAELALFDRNSAELQLVVKDDRGTDAGARAATEEAIGAGAELILGPLFSKSVVATAPIARKAGVPVIAFSNDPAVAGPGVYLIGPTQANEISRVIGYAASKGRQRFAALIPGDGEGKIQDAAFRAAVAKSGGTVGIVEHYPVAATGLIEPARRVAEAIKAAEAGSAPIDALFLPAGEDTLPQLASLIPHIGIDTTRVKLIGTSGWDSPNVARHTQLAAAWIAAPEPRGWREFTERFGKAYNQMPPRLGTLAHDAVVLASTLAGGAKGERFSAANLTRTSGFSGADGAFRLTSTGLADHSLAVLELQASGLVVIDAAPPVAGTLAPQAALGADDRRGLGLRVY